jgi:hypothetical protein
MYYLPNITMVIKSMRLRWTGHMAHMRRGFGGKPEGKRSCARPRC